MRTEGEYDEAAEWTEWAKSRMRLRPGGSSTDLRGVDAAAFGADLIERSKGGRPSIDPDAEPGPVVPAHRTANCHQTATTRSRPTRARA